MNQAKTYLAFWLRMVCFLLILAVVLGYTVYVLTPKHDYGICPITTFYAQEEDTIDVLVLGTSCAYTAVNTNVLYREYGIAAYNLCTAEQPYWITYHYLEEALKTQRPRLILLDAKASIYQEDYSKRGRTILATYGIRDLGVRMRAIAACVAEGDFMDYALAFPQLHSYYAEVGVENFAVPPTNGGRGPDWKGYIEMDETMQHEAPIVAWTNRREPLNARQEEYFRKTIELAQAHDIPVLLMGFPNPDYANEHAYYNSLWRVAKEYGVTAINYNDPDVRTKLKYATDFADWQHLNVRGGVVFSRELGEILTERYDLPDRRGETAYASWARCAEDWYAQYPQYEPKTEE